MNTFQEVGNAEMQQIEGGNAVIAAVVVGAVIVGAGVLAYQLGKSDATCLTK